MSNTANTEFSKNIVQILNTELHDDIKLSQEQFDRDMISVPKSLQENFDNKKKLFSSKQEMLQNHIRPVLQRLPHSLINDRYTIKYTACSNHKLGANPFGSKDNIVVSFESHRFRQLGPGMIQCPTPKNFKVVWVGTKVLIHGPSRDPDYSLGCTRKTPKSFDCGEHKAIVDYLVAQLNDQ